MAYVIGASGYLFCAVIVAAVFAHIGKANPTTLGDSWTGDSALDLWSLVLWPLSLLVLVAMLTGRRIATAVIH